MPSSVVRSCRFLIALSPLIPGALGAQQSLPSVEEKTRGWVALDGFVPMYWDSTQGKLWLKLTRFETDLLYVVSMPRGLGSNDVGLDRGQLGGERVVRFRRVGPRVLLIQPNLAFRAETSDAEERRAVEHSFATSVLFGFRIEAESPGAVLVDATDFALRDAHDAIGALRRARQGTFRLDPLRSAVYLPNTRGFPRNTEIEVMVTLAGESPGQWVRDVTPTPEAVTVHQRHSFVALPEPGYRARASDPRAGFFGIRYLDYATPINQPIARNLISRHRLAKRDPAAAVSEAVAPIVYYVDRGAPEPIRSALLEGARWWNQAFAAAGYRDAFRVELLPEGADPMDVRYNVIQWVHRSTRGWSYGGTVTDPRTGEIIKGHVTLGSLRVRQDLLIAQGLLLPFEQGDEPTAELERMALARIRQLSAHEVGHTLGIQHNYVASAQGRASVMDYPHPVVARRADGTLDVSQAYAEGIGAWDIEAIRFGYQHFPDGTDEHAALDGLIQAARRRGFTFLTDADARPPGSAHPSAHLWDNGTDAVAELDRVMAVRRTALARFGERALPRGAPLATLEEVLVPLYLHHRYQVEAAAKLVAGQFYDYGLRGDGSPPPRPVPAEQQRQALDAVLRTLAPSALALPRHLLTLIPPRPPDHPRHRELFESTTVPVFDAVSPAAAAADLVVNLVLQSERAARLVTQQAIDPELPGLEAVIEQLFVAAFDAPVGSPYEAEIARAVQRVVVDRLMQLALTARMPQVRAVASRKLSELTGRPVSTGARTPANRAARALFAQDIRRFLERPFDPTTLPRPLDAPPGSPIGARPERLDP